MARQTPRHRVDAEAHLLAGGTQLAHQFTDRVLGLGHRHAVTRHDDHAVGVVEGAADATGVDRHLLALDLLGRPLGTAEATEDDADEVAVHRLAHDVRQDGTGGAHQRTGDDQQVIGQGEADSGRGPARVAVEHRHHHRHVGAADAEDQVPADEEGEQSDQQQGPEAGTVEVGDGQHQRENRRTGVQGMTAGVLLRLAVDLAGQLAEGDHRAGEGHRTDEHAQHHLDLQEGQLGRCLVGQSSGERRQAVEGLTGRLQRQHPGAFHLGVPADKHRRQTDEGVQRRHQLRHLGHLDPLGHHGADHGTDNHQRNHQPVVADVRAEHDGEHRQAHTDDAVPHRALGLFLIAQSPQREDEQHTRRDRRGGYELLS